ncbi:MAG: triphosphoribosyl-dephospho-CoA synthase [Gemmataceae bacterium]
MDSKRDIPLATGVCAEVACLLEVTARKAGNVHGEKEFADTRFVDFVLSAAAIGPVLAAAEGSGVGATVLKAMQATRRLVKPNTNLGILLLLAPLAAVPRETPLVDGLPEVLRRLNIDDARLVYEAIRLAGAGGMGEVERQDIRAAPTQTLAEVMSLAADRDLIARQYGNDFHDVLHDGAPFLRDAWTNVDWERAIQWTHLRFIAAQGDTLIARKRGPAESAEASRRARSVLAAGFPAAAGEAPFAAFDAWLRQDGNARNPGTSADLVTACLFSGLREGWLKMPLPAQSQQAP